MAFPPGFLDELRARITPSAIVGRKVVWDRGKTNAARGDYWAPCPFHQEKTASFHIDDRKGFYKCFGCGASGDIITFVRETENVSFIEAVEFLARDVGLEMPRGRETAGDRAKRDRLTRLAEVMEDAVRAFGLGLRSAAGQAARDYAAARGLDAETLRRFEIGYAARDRTALTAKMRESGCLDEAIEAGLVIRPEDGAAPYDRFRDRLMFPIRDPRGRCIAFGGRALSPEARAKYLNSPETPLFQKGRTLYNHGPAREAAGRADTLVVAEGYMDVIALARAGVAHALAPLGTAVTEEQLNLLWRIVPEPVFALDGDAAGLRAAHKVLDLALPKLGAEKTLRFALLPPGKDPDDLLREGGVQAVEAALAGSVPFIDLLWTREREAQPLDTPERRSGFERRWRAAVAQIPDPLVRSHYEDELKRRQWSLFRGLARPADSARRPWPGRRGAPPPPPGPLPQTRGSALAQTVPEDVARRDAARLREATILLVALENPGAAGALADAIDDMPLETEAFAPHRRTLLAHLDGTAAPDVLADARSAFGAVGPARAHPMARPRPDEAGRVRAVLEEAIARHRALIGLWQETAEAARELADADSEAWTWRLRQSRAACAEVDAAALAASEAEDKDAESPLAAMLEAAEARHPKTKITEPAPSKWKGDP
ncbi:MAG: DNA primase [Paracoccaceae bacterium]